MNLKITSLIWKIQVLKAVKELAKKVLNNDRLSVAKAITLVESSRLDHREKAVELISLLSGSGNEALKIGLSGTPGVGNQHSLKALA